MCRSLAARQHLVNDVLDDHDMYLHATKLECLTERQLHYRFGTLRDGPKQLFCTALEEDFLRRGGALDKKREALCK